MKNKVIEILKDMDVKPSYAPTIAKGDTTPMVTRLNHIGEFRKQLAARIDAEYSGGVSEIIGMPDMSDRDWKEDFSLENGNYQCMCIRCKKAFYGYKRRVVCKLCTPPTSAQSNREIAMKWWSSISTDMKMMWTGQYYPGQSHNLLTGSEIEKMFKGRGK